MSIDITPRSSLLSLNLALLVILAAVLFIPEPEVVADPYKSNSSKFMAVPSSANGVPSGVVFLLDTYQGELVAVAYNHNLGKIMPLGYRNTVFDASTIKGTE